MVRHMFIVENQKGLWPGREVAAEADVNSFQPFQHLPQVSFSNFGPSPPIVTEETFHSTAALLTSRLDL